MLAAPPVVAVARSTLQALMLSLFALRLLDLPALAGLALYAEQWLAVVVGLATALVLLDRHARRWRDVLSAVGVLVVFGFVALRYPSLQAAMVPAKPLSVLLAACMLGAVLEATRRRLGWFLPALIVALAVLVLAGTWLPAGIQPRPVGAARMLVYLGFDGNALLGRILATAAFVIVPFIVFGALFAALGGGQRLAALAASLIGSRRGGAAKVSVAGSAAFGMVSGSAVANVAAVGAVTIPMMVRAGYPRHLAAGIEAVASTGGQLAPPIMGASAFLMAEFLQMPYGDIVLAALLPAAMFYAALWMAVDFEAVGSARAPRRIAPMPSSRPRATLLRAALPVAVLIYLLFVAGSSPDRAAGLGVLTLVATCLWGAPGRLPDRARRLWSALGGAMDTVADIVLVGAAAGLVVGVLNISGLYFALSLQALELGRDSMALLLAGSAALSVLLGMGMPTVGVYALLALLLAPALVAHGVTPLGAHLYVLYFGMFSMITPPVALASISAASVAGADPWRTSLASLRMAAGVYLVPLAFVLQPELLLQGAVLDTAVAVIRLLLAIALATAAMSAHADRLLSLPCRVLAVLLALANVAPRGDALPEMLVALAFACGVALLPSLRPLRAAPA